MNRPNLTNERLLATFLLGLLLFLPPVLGIFNVAQLAIGVPVLFLYSFTAWALIIALAALIVSGSSDEEDLLRRSEEQGNDEAAGG